MVDWFHPKFKLGTVVITLEKGFTDNQIALMWLDHFIEHTHAGPDEN
jgi:hypothetical protein